jgi:hypothetical protein
MSTVILAAGAGAANSSDLVVTAGQETVVFAVCATPLPGNFRAAIQLKANDASYQTIGWLSAQTPAITLDSPGTYRFARMACAASVGLENT